jgi:hypothetical protein
MVSGRRGWKVAAGAALAFGAIAGCGELAGLGDRPTLLEDEAGALRANAPSSDAATSAGSSTSAGEPASGDASDERGDGQLATSDATELVYDGFEGDPASRWETLTSSDGGVAGFDLGRRRLRVGRARHGDSGPSSHGSTSSTNARVIQGSNGRPVYSHFVTPNWASDGRNHIERVPPRRAQVAKPLTAYGSADGLDALASCRSPIASATDPNAL